jgi:hypothetical protein
MDFFKKHKKDSNDNNNNKVGDNDTTATTNTNYNDDSSSEYKKAVETGASIAKILTSKWNSQKKPGKVYVGNRRVHHGAVGSIMNLSNAFKKDEPTVTGIISGIGEGLVKDDYKDKDEWFKFNKKEDEVDESSSLESK